MRARPGSPLARRVVPALAALLLFAVPAAAAEKKAGKGEDPHARKDAKGCLACHVSVPPAGAADPALRFGGDPTALCASCHGGYSHMHPVKITVAPDMKSPEELPLDREGRITCITCHDPMVEKGIHTKRRVTGRGLCLNCHFDSDILAQVIWYPTRLKGGETGRLELKVVEFRVLGKKRALGASVLLYYYAKDVDSGEIRFGTDVLYDDGTNGDRVSRDGIFTLIEKSDKSGKKKRVVYTAWVLDPDGRKSNTVTMAVEYE